MTDKSQDAFKLIHAALSGIETVSLLLPLVREDMERRLKMQNRETRQLDTAVETVQGAKYPFLTLETEPDTGFMTMIDIHVTTPGDVALAEDALRRVKGQVEKLIDLFLALELEKPTSATDQEKLRSSVSAAEVSRRKSEAAARAGMRKHLGLPALEDEE